MERGIAYKDEIKINKCTRLLNSGLKKYNPLLFTDVMKYVKSKRDESSKGLQKHSFELSEVDKHILGDLTIEHLGGVVYSISCEDILYEYTMTEPIVYRGKCIPGTKSSLANKIKFKIDYLHMCNKIK